MKRNEAIELLEKYNLFLIQEGWFSETIWQKHPNTLNRFMESDWALENLLLNITPADILKEYQHTGRVIIDGDLVRKNREDNSVNAH